MPYNLRYLRNDAALGEKLPTLAAPLWFVASYAVNPFAQKQFKGHIVVADS